MLSPEFENALSNINPKLKGVIHFRNSSFVFIIIFLFIVAADKLIVVRLLLSCIV